MKSKSNMKVKKTPRDYPQFTFRVSAEDKKRLNNLIHSLVKYSNRGLPIGQKVLRNNDVIVDALYLGLLTLKRKNARFKVFPK